MNPRVAETIHVAYPDAVLNRDSLPCRAAIVTAPAREGRIPVTILPVFHNPYPDVAYEWHYPKDCPRDTPHVHFPSPGWVCPEAGCGWSADRDPIDAVEAYRG